MTFGLNACFSFRILGLLFYQHFIFQTGHHQQEWNTLCFLLIWCCFALIYYCAVIKVTGHI